MSPATPDTAKVPLTRVDLHVHTRASRRGATGWLDALGVAESYAEPQRVYDLARARGMNLVAVTDHDTIDGAMALVERGLPGVIVGEEVTTRLPPDGRLLHVLVWMLTPADHDEIGRLGLRRDAVALAHWLREKNLPHALAHPLYDMSGGLSRAVLERCMLLFGGFEAINAGHTTAAHRAAFARFLTDTDSQRFAELTTELGEPALWPRYWLTAGSDDHAMLNLARAWTAAPGAGLAPEAFFRAIMAGEGLIGGRDATSEALAHQFLGVAGGFALSPANAADGRVTRATRLALSLAPSLRRVFDAATAPTADADADHRRLGDAIDAASRESLDRLSALALGEPDTWSLFGARDALDVAGVAAPMLLTQAAELAAAIQHVSEQRLLRELTHTPALGSESQATPALGDGGRGVCLFVDALDHVSGVSRFVLDLARSAASLGRPLTVFTCGEADPTWPANIVAIEPMGALPTPGYAGLSLAVPRLAALIERCAACDPAAIHVSTPGSVGIAGMLAARALRTPLLATHHTDLPAYARQLMGSAMASFVAERGLGSLYGRCARVLARSAVSAERVAAMGVPRDRLRVITPGIDLSRFGASRRDRAVWDGFPGVSRSSVKALSVGRVSAEKNLPMLAEVWRSAEARLSRAGVCAELIVVGDGPWLGEMRRALRGTRARLLGEIRDERLPMIYASSDLFVFPSTTETLGQVVIEAQASGLPAVVSTEGGPAEIVRHGRTGLTLDAGDPSAWARAIASLAADAERRRAMGRAAAAHARGFSFERSFESFWSIHAETAPAGSWAAGAPHPLSPRERVAQRREAG